MTINKKNIENVHPRSAWMKGVKEYALEMLEDINGDVTGKNIEKVLLNGAQDWKEYSYAGCALIYNRDIAERLCTPSEFRKTQGGKRRPNSRETWLDVQARALYQAYQMIIDLCF